MEEGEALMPKQRTEVFRLMLKEVDENGEGMTRWEKDFCESITERLDAGGALTKAQTDRLWETHDRRTGGRP